MYSIETKVEPVLFSLFAGLAVFAGSICKKYNVELAGLLQYVANQLKAGKRWVVVMCINTNKGIASSRTFDLILV